MSAGYKFIVLLSSPPHTAATNRGSSNNATLETHFFDANETQVFKKLFARMPVHGGYHAQFVLMIMNVEWVFYCNESENPGENLGEKFDASIFLGETVNLSCRWVRDAENQNQNKKKNDERVKIEDLQKEIERLASEKKKQESIASPMPVYILVFICCSYLFIISFIGLMIILHK